MDAISLGAVAHERSGIVFAGPRPDEPTDTAWMVLEAANDLGDDATVESCRRVIDAHLNGSRASQSDLRIIFDYFR